MAAVAQPVAKSSFEHLVLDFLAYLEFERGLSRNTLEAYRSDLLQYGRYLEGHDTTAVGRDGPADRQLPGRARWREGRGGVTGHDPPQGGMPALLLPPPQARGHPRDRPDGQRDRTAPRAQAAPGAHPRTGEQAAGPAQGHRAHGPPRHGPAGADVRVRAAGVRGDRAAGERRGPRRGNPARAGQGLQGAGRADRQLGGGGGAALPGARASRPWCTPAARRGCS